MDYFITPPNDDLDLTTLGDGLFCLAQHYRDNKMYRNFFKARKEEGWFIILDNGGGDGEQVPALDLAWCARDLKPDEIIPIDVIGDREQTHLNIGYARSMIPKDVKILACPQGANIAEYFASYHDMLTDDRVDSIAISKIAVTMAMRGHHSDQAISESRSAIIRALDELNLIRKPIHLLGAENAKEFAQYKDIGLIRSNDSCLAVWSAMNNQLLSDPNFQRISTPSDYFTRTVPMGAYEMVKENVVSLRSC